jgi:hypothetical protein
MHSVRCPTAPELSPPRDASFDSLPSLHDTDPFSSCLLGVKLLSDIMVNFDRRGIVESCQLQLKNN